MLKAISFSLSHLYIFTDGNHSLSTLGDTEPLMQLSAFDCSWTQFFINMRQFTSCRIWIAEITDMLSESLIRQRAMWFS